MRDLNILRFVANNCWAIEDAKWHDIVPVLMRHVRGDRLSAEELQAILGDGGGQPATSSTRGAIAVIPIRGVIAPRMGALDDTSGGTSSEGIARMIQAAAVDDRIGTIVYDVDSPGGAVPGIQELAQMMFDLRGQKTQIAVANHMMASAAYYLASQADEIVATPSASVGSIGVIWAHQDISQALEKEGIKVSLITAGKYKAENNPFNPLTEEGRAQMQQRVDEAYGQFVNAVARGRDVTASEVKSGFGEGRVLSASDAVAAGLVDRVGTLADTLDQLIGRKSSGAGMRAAVEREELMAGTVDALAAPAVDEDVDRAARRDRL